MKHVSDGERLAIAKLNRTETELTKARKEISNLHAQLRAMTAHITELQNNNKHLCAQIHYLVYRPIKWESALN